MVSPTIYRDRSRINELTDQAVGVADDILDEFNVEYRRNYKRFYGPCPVHGGDNQLAFNFFPDGYEVRGMWTCHTRHCEKKWKKTFIGLIHGLLSREYSDSIQWTVALDWLLNFLRYKQLSDIVLPDESILKLRAATSISEKWSLTTIRHNTGWNRPQVRNNLILPANYYLKRGFSANTLDKYDVGTYNKQERVIVPVYDDDYNYAVGFTKRSIHEKCQQCGEWHGNGKCRPFPKWEHSKSFHSSLWLYNYWFAKRYIEESSIAILVEGPGDVWRLEEAGIHNSLGMFGVDLTEEQIGVLETSGAMSFIVLLDNDDAGRQAAIEIKKRLGRIFRLYFPTIVEDDVGEMLNKDELSGTINHYVKNSLNHWG